MTSQSKSQRKRLRSRSRPPSGSRSRVRVNIHPITCVDYSCPLRRISIIIDANGAENGDLGIRKAWVGKDIAAADPDRSCSVRRRNEFSSSLPGSLAPVGRVLQARRRLLLVLLASQQPAGRSRVMAVADLGGGGPIGLKVECHDRGGYGNRRDDDRDQSETWFHRNIPLFLDDLAPAARPVLLIAKKSLRTEACTTISSTCWPGNGLNFTIKIRPAPRPRESGRDQCKSQSCKRASGDRLYATAVEAVTIRVPISRQGNPLASDSSICEAQNFQRLPKSQQALPTRTFWATPRVSPAPAPHQQSAFGANRLMNRQAVRSPRRPQTSA